ncbi:hypothetical protein EV426DRAFT_603888 [Tirmania nivea]|nr:hypothetical protein EV426DRAFT_603888 [Tirmania nivea]
MLLRTLFTSPCRASPCRMIRAIFPSYYASSYSQLADLGKPKDKHHHDLASFRAYAESTGLDPTSTLYRGTVYEYIASNALYHKNMHLIRTGGKSDRGIDLRGEWHIPLPPAILPTPPNLDSSSSPPESPITRTKAIRIIIQCKGHTTVPLGPNIVRELSGTLACELSTTIGFLASMYPCTNGTRNAIRFIQKPMGYVCISNKGVVKQLVWNRLASELLGSGIGVGVRYLNSEVGETNVDGELEQEVVLMFNGAVVDGLLSRGLEVERRPSKKVRKLMQKEASKKASKKSGKKVSKKESI